MLLAALLLARIEFFNDRGEVHSTDEWRGLPVIIAPVFTRCPVACPMITAGLKKALAESNAQPGTYRVVMFSFDPRDTPADLHRFREQHRLPIDWTVASAKEPAIHALMDSIGFRYAQTGGGFTHPNMIVGVTADLKTSKVLVGTEYRAADIENMLAGNDWLDGYAGPVVALLLFVCLGSVAYLFTPRARTRNRPADC
jgi:cytochrome oxidase Cu insertion factor (SCO1/SenC/PrrC family)